LGNLLANAVKYSDPGTPISLSAERCGDEVVVRVRDAGYGIPPDKLREVFEMFAQINRSPEQTKGGLGVGLAIVKRVVEMHGGSVEAHSEGLGRGSEFVVRLPVAAASAAAESQVAEPAAPAGGHRILVADDNVDSATTLANLLELMGNEVRVAHDGEEALETAAAFGADLILLDIGMPKLNGYDVARRIRSQPWGRDVVLVALTGWSQEENRRRSRQAGFDHHVVKPIEPAVMQQLVAGLRGNDERAG
jgi:CheY-like chemotaxis protein